MNRIQPLLTVLTGLAVFALVPISAPATVLTFDQDPPVSNFETVNQSYGDAVTTTNDTLNNFQYDEQGEGFTPNVLAGYDGFDETANNQAVPRLWTTGYGDLSNVLFDDNDAFGQLEVRLTADTGYDVLLYGFDMAAYSTAFAGDPTIDLVRVLDGSGNVLLSQANVVINKTTHTSFDFSSDPLSAPVIRIQFDSGNLGGTSDDIAFDNIRFGQAVPEPTSGVLALLGLGGLALLSRKRRG